MAARPPSPRKEVVPNSAQRPVSLPPPPTAGANASSAGMLLPPPAPRHGERHARPPNNPASIVRAETLDLVPHALPLPLPVPTPDRLAPSANVTNDQE